MSNAQGVMELRLLTSIEREKIFCLLSHTFLCLPKEKYAKERAPRGGVGCIHDGLKFVSAIVPRRKEAAR